MVGENELQELMQNKGEVHFVCGGWQCQSMSMAGPQTGMDDIRFDPFFSMVKIINILQAVQCMPPLYCLENTWPGLGVKIIDDTADLIEMFLGIPLLIDAAGLGSAAHRLRHY